MLSARRITMVDNIAESTESEFRFNYEEELAPIEHVILGSSASMQRGNVDELRDIVPLNQDLLRKALKERDIEMLHKFLCPAGIWRDSRSAEDINEQRERQNRIKTGSFPFMFETFPKGINVFMELGPVQDKEEVSLKWRFFGENMKGEKVSADLMSGLKLEEGYDDLFKYEMIGGVNCLSFDPKIQQDEI